MKSSLQILGWLYSLCLHLYPRTYRGEYSKELKAVFNLALYNASQKGGLSVTGLVLRELYGLPKAIIFEHQRGRRKLKMLAKTDSFLTFEPGSWRETAAALAPFLVFGAFPTFLGYLRLSTIAPKWLEVVLAISLLGLLISLFVIGTVKGFPRWFLPYLGIPMALFSVYIFFDLISTWYKVPGPHTTHWMLSQIAFQGKLWIGLPAGTICVILITGLLPPLRPFYWRLRQDWTLLSFLLYGATLFALLITFDDYINEEPYAIMAMLLLAVGGWFYLRSSSPWRRLLALLTGLTLAMMVAAVGKAILYSSPTWPSPRHFTWQTEAMSTIIIWGWLVLIIVAPILMKSLPRPHNSQPAV